MSEQGPEFPGRARKTITTWAAYSWGFQSFREEPAIVTNGDAGAADAQRSTHVLGFVDPLTGDEHRFLMDDEIRARLIQAMCSELDGPSKHRLVHFLVGAKG